MYRPRVIPTLLLKNSSLVKSTRFSNYHYIGDPINAVKIFNDLRADELVFLDIEASKQNRLVSLDFIHDVGEEANMPFAVGGGIRTLNDIRQIINAGAEKVIIGSSASNAQFIKNASETFGSSTISVCIDVKTKFWKGERVWIKGGTKCTSYAPVEFAKLMELNGAGEIIVQSVDRDGTMEGYDIQLIKKISESVTIPVVALGGAGKIQDLKDAFEIGFANGMACGSLFIYQGNNKGVLINYPSKEELPF